MLCGALVGALCGLAGFFVWVCALGVIRLPGCMVVNANDSALYLSCISERGCVSVCGRVCLCVFLCACVRACLGMVPLCIPLCKPLPYALPYPLRLEHKNMA